MNRVFFPARWLAEPSFEINYRAVSFSGWLFWWVTAAATAGSAICRRLPPPPDFLVSGWVYSPWVLLLVLATIGLGLALHRLLQFETPDVWLIGTGLIPGGLAATAAMAAGVEWSILAAQGMLSFGLRVLAVLKKVTSNPNFLEWQTDFARLESGVGYLVRAGYLVWAGPLMLLARAVRLRSEPLSFQCPDRSCGLVFDDPPLRCHCGVRLHTFPLLSRPWIAACERTRGNAGSCGRTYLTRQPTARLSETAGVPLDSALCRLGCREPAHDDRASCVLIVPVDTDATSNLLRLFGVDWREQSQRSAEEPAVAWHRTGSTASPLVLGLLRFGLPPYWAGGWDGVILPVAADSDSRTADLMFGLRHIALPREPGGWGRVIRLRRRGRFARLVKRPRPAPSAAPYGRREMPRLAAFPVREPIRFGDLALEPLSGERASVHAFAESLRRRQG